MKRSCTTLALALFAACGLPLWPSAGAPQDNTQTAQSMGTYSGNGEDVMGTSKFAYELKYTVQGEKIEGTLKLADHTGKGGTYKLEHGLLHGNTLQFSVRSVSCPTGGNELN